MLSVVIPALDEAARIAAAVESVRAGDPTAEIVVADGGSADATRDVATGLGARVVAATRGRGNQLAAGAGAARGDWLLFLHADTVLEKGWAEAARVFMNAPENADRAAVFAFALDDESRAARRLERLVGLRVRLLALPYGDQGLLISRDFYAALGGYRPMPMFEDVDLARRIGRKRLSLLEARAVTSAERFRRDGYLARPARNFLCVLLYFAGLPPAWIRRIYR